MEEHATVRSTRIKLQSRGLLVQGTQQAINIGSHLQPRDKVQCGQLVYHDVEDTLVTWVVIDTST